MSRQARYGFVVAAAVAAALELRAGSGGDPADWDPAPAPASVTVRRGAGAGGADRVTVTWGDNAVRNGWLRVALAATPATGLTFPDVFYFGNLVGDTGLGNRDNAAATTVTDLGLSLRQPFRAGVPITSAYDFDRDGRVSALDLRAVRSNLVRTLAALSAPTRVDAPPPPAGLGRTEEETGNPTDLLR